MSHSSVVLFMKLLSKFLKARFADPVPTKYTAPISETRQNYTI